MDVDPAYFSMICRLRRWSSSKLRRKLPGWRKRKLLA
jgi:hypothetical protein